MRAYPTPDEAFMAVTLVPGALKGWCGRVRYWPECAEV
jgi:predicted N-acetyltransferase YhbS